MYSELNCSEASMAYVCELCGKEFIPVDTSPSHLARRRPRFCSKECGERNRSNGDLVQCTQCGKDIYRRKSYLAATRDPFCSHKCYGQWQKLHIRASKSDLRFYRHNHNIALRRDHYTCQDCGKTHLETKLITHHIVEVGPEGRDDRYSNLVTLCQSCHRKRHHN